MEGAIDSFTNECMNNKWAGVHERTNERHRLDWISSLLSRRRTLTHVNCHQSSKRGWNTDQTSFVCTNEDCIILVSYAAAVDVVVWWQLYGNRENDEEREKLICSIVCHRRRKNYYVFSLSCDRVVHWWSMNELSACCARVDTIIWRKKSSSISVGLFFFFF